MATKLLGESAADPEVIAEAAIRKRVLEDINRTGPPMRVRVNRLWENHYRVNVYAGHDVLSACITHSYFVVADASGGVVESTPVL
jgi:hypothetical protein